MKNNYFFVSIVAALFFNLSVASAGAVKTANIFAFDGAKISAYLSPDADPSQVQKFVFTPTELEIEIVKIHQTNNLIVHPIDLNINGAPAQASGFIHNGEITAFYLSIDTGTWRNNLTCKGQQEEIGFKISLESPSPQIYQSQAFMRIYMGCGWDNDTAGFDYVSSLTMKSSL